MTSTQTIFLSSNQSGAQVSPIKDNFSIQLRNPLRFAKGSRPRLAVQSASIWNTFPNISTSQANNIIYYTDNASLPQKYNIILDSGAYGDILDLNPEISNKLQQNGHSGTLIQLIYMPSSGKVVIEVDSAGWAVYWPVGTPYKRLGITLNTKMPASGLTAAAQLFYADNIIDLAPLSSIYVHCNLAAGASIVNGAPASAIATIIPNARSGSLITYTPNYPMWLNLDAYDGSFCDNISMRLTTEDGVSPVDTGGEHWNITIMLETKE